MERHDLFLTVAQMGVTLAALSGIAGVLGHRSQGEIGLDRLSVRLLRDVAVIGLFAAFCALLPLVFGEVSTVAWRAYGSVALTIWIILYSGFLREWLRLRQSESTQPWMWAGMLGGAVITLVGLAALAHIAIAPSADSAQWYAFAILCLLALAGLNFLAGAFRSRALSPATEHEHAADRLPSSSPNVAPEDAP